MHSAHILLSITNVKPCYKTLSLFGAAVDPFFIKPMFCFEVNVVLEQQSTYTAETDKLVLEDETMRVQLIGKVSPPSLQRRTNWC